MARPDEDKIKRRLDEVMSMIPCPVAGYRHIDTYKPGTYPFETDKKQMATGPGGYVH